jgi:hypothetical protein
MHRFGLAIAGIGLAAQSALRQPKKQVRVWASHMVLDLSVIPGRCGSIEPDSRDSPMRNCASEVWP